MSRPSGAQKENDMLRNEQNRPRTLYAALALIGLACFAMSD